MKMTVFNMVDACILGTNPVIELIKLDYNGRKKETDYYNYDTLPAKYVDYPVSFIENVKQYDNTTALIFTVYEKEGMPEAWKEA